MPRVIVKVLPLSSRGVLGAVAYNSRPDPSTGGRKVADRVFAVFGNLPVDRNNQVGMARALEASAVGTRSPSYTRRVILSFEKTKDAKEYARWANAAQPLGEVFARTFAPHSHYYGWVHVDQDNVNVHLEVSNRDSCTGRALRWDKSVIRQMNALRWAPPVGGASGAGAAPAVEFFSAGAGSYMLKQDIAHPSRGLDDLLDLVAVNPCVELERLIRSGAAKLYHTKSGRPGVVYGERRHTLAGLNFALRARGCKVGVDDDLRPKNLDRDERGCIARQNYHDMRLGIGRLPLAEYDKIMDNPVLSGAPERVAVVQDFLRYGKRPEDRQDYELLARVLNTHLKRKLVYKAKEWSGPNTEAVRWIYGLGQSKQPQVSHNALKMAKRFSQEFLPMVRERSDLDRFCDQLDALFGVPQLQPSPALSLDF